MASAAPLVQSTVLNPTTNQPVAGAPAAAAQNAPAAGWGANLKSACTRIRTAAAPFFANVLLLGGMGVSFPAGSVYLTNQLIKKYPTMKGALVWLPAVAIGIVSMVLILEAGNNLMNYFRDQPHRFAPRLFGYEIFSLTEPRTKII